MSKERKISDLKEAKSKRDKKGNRLRFPFLSLFDLDIVIFFERFPLRSNLREELGLVFLG